MLLPIILIGVLTCVVIVIEYRNWKYRNESKKEIDFLKSASNYLGIDLRSAKTEYTEENRSLSERIDSIITDSTNTANTINSIFATIESINKENVDSIKHIEESLKLISEKTDKIDTITNNNYQKLNKEIDNIKNIQNAVDGNIESLKRKLDFYLNIEDAAENISGDTGGNNRKRLIETVSKQINEENNSLFTDQELSETVESLEKTGVETNKYNLLDADQHKALEIMEKTQKNLFITGKAGTGKSFLLDVFKETTEKQNIVLAPTGVAAVNVKGATIHSTFGWRNLVEIDVNDLNAQTVRLKQEKEIILKETQVIIIDEISMVRADVFEKIDRILRIINKNESPFGGKQMIVFGDVFQLPPVVQSKNEYEFLHDRYGGIFFFNTDSYKDGGFEFIELTINHRQKEDAKFFSILNHIREGVVNDSDIDQLNSRYIENPDDKYNRYISLFTKRSDAKELNDRRLSMLETKEYTYLAEVDLDSYPGKNKNVESLFPILPELKLKVGAVVMMVSNDLGNRWINGSMGIVESLSEDNISVSFGKNKTYSIYPVTFEQYELTYVNKKINYKPVYAVTQYPIIPAYAITIHKSQGQTYNDIVCDVTKCFESGQAYVALSRCTHLEGLHLRHKINKADIMVNPSVIGFYKSQKSIISTN